MVSKLKNLFARSTQGIHEAAFLIAALSLCSQILALLRDKLLAHTFGAGIELDVYWSSFRIPDLLYTSLSSVLAVIIILPFLAERLEKGSEEMKRFLNSVFTVFILSGFCIAAILFILMPSLAPYVVPGLREESRETFILLSRILLLSPILLGVSNLLGSVSQLFKRFFIFSLAPVLYNLGIIFGIIVLYPKFGLQGIAWGVIVGALLHVAIQIPVSYSKNLIPKPTSHIDWGIIRSVLSVSFSRILTLGFTQLSMLGYIAIASTFAAGSISIFTLAYNLQSVPLTLIGVSYSVAAFPVLAELFVSKNTEAFKGYIISALRHIIFWALPITVAFIILRAHIVRIIFGSGAFTWTDTKLTAAVLALFSVSLLAQSVTLLLLRASYAAKENRIPLVTQGVAMIGGLFLLFAILPLIGSLPHVSYFIESLFRVSDLTGTTVLLLGVFFSGSSVLGTLLLWYFLYKKGIAPHPHPIRRTFFESFSASLIAGFACYQFLAFSGTFLPNERFWGILLQASGGLVVGFLSWVLVLFILKSKELHEVASSIRHKFWKVETIPPEQSDL